MSKRASWLSRAIQLRKLGLSYSEVWRQLGVRVSRQYVWKVLKREGL